MIAYVCDAVIDISVSDGLPKVDRNRRPLITDSVIRLFLLYSLHMGPVLRKSTILTFFQ